LWRASIVAGLILVLGLGSGGVAAERQGGAEPAVQPTVQGAESAVQLIVQGDKISAKFERAQLGVVLTELARQADLTVYITKSDAQQTVSAKFEALPLTEGIKRILQDKNYVLMTAPTLSAEGKPSGQRVAKIRVLSMGEAYTKLTGDSRAEPTGSPTLPAAQDAKTLEDLKRDALESSDPNTRLAALQKLSGLQGQVEDAALAAIVVPAMHDTTPEVRQKALSMVHRVEGREGELVNHIAEMAQNDADPRLRAAALGYLAAIQDTDAQGYLEQALQDPDPGVKRRAQRLLSQLQSPSDAMEDSQAPPQESPPATTQKK
jgi:hypothetical protein